MECLRPTECGRIVARARVSGVSSFSAYVDLPGEFGADKDEDVYLFVESITGIMLQYQDASGNGSANYVASMSVYMDIPQPKSFNTGGVGYQKQGLNQKLGSLGWSYGALVVVGGGQCFPVTLRNDESLPFKIRPSMLQNAYVTFTVEVVDNRRWGASGFQFRNTDPITIVLGVAKISDKSK